MTLPAIQTRGLTRFYGRTVGVESLDLDVEPGEIFGFLGPNGAGKTTTMRLLLDLIRPTRGEARLFGRPTHDPEVRSRIGYLPGELVLDARMTGRRTLEFLELLGGTGASEETRRRREELCERLVLTSADLGRRVRQYSRGMKQKLGLAAAFQHDPELLVLDEPTTGLDPLMREVVFELLADAGKRGATVFHSSHVLSEVDRTCTRVGILRDGRLAALLRVDELRQASARRVVIHFSGEVPVGELVLPGVEVVEREGSRVVLKMTGDPERLLAVLARHPVRHLTFPEPGLEEAFAEYYRGDE
jgi:ABC-2 type transport system ATP-binding protein